MEKLKVQNKLKESSAQEALRLELEKNKLLICVIHSKYNN